MNQLEQMRADTLRDFGPGHCPFCQGLIPAERRRGRPLKRCRSHECLLSYYRVLCAMQRERRKASPS